MSDAVGYVRYAFRILKRYPGVTLTSVVALALGIGLTGTMFSIVYGALFRGLPFPDADRMMHLERSNLSRGIESMEVTVHDYHDWREQQTSFVDLGAYYSGTVNLRGTERAERFQGAFMTASSFGPLATQPLVGRLFNEEEDDPGAAPVILISHDLWRDRFDSSRDVVGQVLTVNGEATTVVGVMPEGFGFPNSDDVWLPMKQNPLELERGSGVTLEVFGVLKPGVSMDQAIVEFNGITQRLAQEYPETNEGVGPVIKPYTEEAVGEQVSGVLLSMLGAVFMVLLVACANVANLLLARAAMRTKEVAIRTAMGASRMRVVGQLLGEALALAVLGASLGVGIAWLGTTLFANAVASTNPPFWLVFKLDGPVLIFVLSLSVVAGLVSGVIPALQASRAHVNDVLKDESRGSSSLRIGRFSKALIVAQIAFSVAALVGSGLMIKSVTNLQSWDYGFDQTNLFTARMGLFEATHPDAESQRAFFREVERRVAGVPEISASAISAAIPALGSGGASFGLEGESYLTDQDYPIGRYNAVSAGFFDVYGDGVLSGRSFTRQDLADTEPVAIVNESFVRRFSADRDVFGRRVRLGRSESENPWRTIVGIVPDMWMQGLGNLDDGSEGIYVPYEQRQHRFMTLSARVAGPNPLGITEAVREVVAGVDPDVPIYNVDTLEGTIQSQTWFLRVFGALFLAFGAAALFLASVGLYGVMSFAVTRRTHEVGVRMALGAQGKTVLRLMMRQGVVQFGIGLSLGLVLAVFLAGPLQALTLNVDARDPLIYATVAGVLFVTAMISAFIPALRSTRISPMEAFRYD